MIKLFDLIIRRQLMGGWNTCFLNDFISFHWIVGLSSDLMHKLKKMFIGLMHDYMLALSSVGWLICQLLG